MIKKENQTYKLSIKSGARMNMADEIDKEDIDIIHLPIDIIHLPSGVQINSITVSTETPDGTTIKITFKDGAVQNQELAGLVSYESKSTENT